MQRFSSKKFFIFYPLIISFLAQFLYTASSANVEVTYQFFEKDTASGVNKAVDGLHNNKMFWFRLTDRIKGFLLIFIDIDDTILADKEGKFNVTFDNIDWSSIEDENKLFKSNIGTIRAYFIGKDPDAVDLDPLNEKLKEGSLLGILNEITVYDKLTSRTYFSRREYDLVVMHSISSDMLTKFVKNDLSSMVGSTKINAFDSTVSSEFNEGFEIISYNKPNIISNNFKILLPFEIADANGTWAADSDGTANSPQQMKYTVKIEIDKNAGYQFRYFGKDYTVKTDDMEVIDVGDAEKIEERIKEIMGVVDI